MKKFIVIGIICALVLAGFILVRSGFVLERVRRVIVSKTGAEIEGMEGNLFTHITVKRVILKNGATIEGINIRFTPMALIRRTVNSVNIATLSLKYKRSTGKAKFTLPVSVNKFFVENGLFTGIPCIGNITTHSILGSAKRRLNNFTFNIEEINGIIQGNLPFHIRGNLEWKNGVFHIKSLNVATKKSNIALIGKLGKFSAELAEWSPLTRINLSGDVTGTLSLKKGLKAHLNIANLGFIPYSLHKSVGFNFIPIGTGSINIKLVEKKANIVINSWKIGKGSLKGTVNLDTGRRLSYSSILKIRNFDCSTYYPGIPTLLSGNVNLNGDKESTIAGFNLAGSIKEANIKKIAGDVLIHKNDIRIKTLTINDSLSIGGDIKNRELNLTVKSNNLPLSDFVTDLSGAINLDLSFRGELKELITQGSLYITDGVMHKLRFKYLSSNLNIRGIHNPQGSIEFALVTAQFGKLKFDECRATITGEKGLQMIFSGKGENLSLYGNGMEKDNKFNIRELNFGFENLKLTNNGDILFNMKPGNLSLERCILSLNGGYLEANGGWTGNDINITAIGQGIDLHNLYKEVVGEASFSLDINGSFANPSAELEATINNALLEGVKVDRVYILADFKDELLSLKKMYIKFGPNVSEINGYIPCTLLPPKLLDRKMKVDVVLKQLGPPVFRPLRKFILVKRGVMDVNLKLMGTPNNPVLNGESMVHSGNVYIPSMGLSLDKLETYITFTKNRVNIVSFSSKTKKGWLKMGGDMALAKLSPENMGLNLSLSGKKIPIDGIQDIEALVDIDFTIGGTIKKPDIRGNITIDKALITAPFEMGVIPIETPIIFDLYCSAPGHIWIKNPLVDMEMGGELRARKVDHNCFISGTMQVKRGYYYYLDRAFDIKKGEFRFENTPGINPNITLHSETTIKYRTTTSEEKLEENSCIVNLDVTGKLQKPEINLWSEPSLPEQDIVLLLSLNRPLSGLGSLQQLTPTIPSRALDYFIRTALLSSIEKTIGVDALYLQTDVLGEKRKAKVTVGKYISKDLYVSYTRDLFATSREAFRTEYRLSPRSRIVGERTEEGKSNVNFEVEFRY